MDDRTAVGGVVLLSGLSLFVAGAFGPVLLGAAIVLVSLVFQTTADTDSGDDGPKTSCPNCGARNPTTRAECYYCDEPL